MALEVVCRSVGGVRGKLVHTHIQKRILGFGRTFLLSVQQQAPCSNSLCEKSVMDGCDLLSYLYMYLLSNVSFKQKRDLS